MEAKKQNDEPLDSITTPYFEEDETWEDSVMKIPQVEGVLGFKVPDSGLTGFVVNNEQLHRLRLERAEITAKYYASKVEKAKERGLEAGKVLGRKEVVDNLPKNLFVGDLPPQEGKPYQYLGCYILKWGKEDKPTVGLCRLSDNEKYQAKLKEWGL